MSPLLQPTSFAELTEAVRSSPRVLAVGAKTKPRLSAVDAVQISTLGLRGVSEYDPSEFTITAHAGTPVREIAAVLAEHGQYLPFDPLWVDAGATLGGTVAAGLSGPGRLRFGGVRDFILGVRFVNGAGQLLRLGGKVVKNAAGFDLPKFFIGSLGRFGVLAELTFKVFPRPTATRTLRLESASLETAVRVLTEAASSRFEFDALDLAPHDPGVLARLVAPGPAVDALAREVLARWPGLILPPADAEMAWARLREFSWCEPETPLVKIPISPNSVATLSHAVAPWAGGRLHVCGGGNIAYIALHRSGSIADFDRCLSGLGWSGMTLRGLAPLWLGQRARPAIAEALKVALDPEQRFPSLDD